MTHARAVRPVEGDKFEWSADHGVAAQVRHVVDEAAREDGRAPLNEAALLQLRHHGLAGSTLLVSGEPVEGFAWVHGPSSEPEVDLVVAPADRGCGIGAALASAAAARVPGRLSAWSHGNHPAAAALADRLGFDRVRDLWVMRRPLDVPLPPVWDIDGIDVRAFRPGQDEEAFLALNAEAFAHHPEQGQMTRADLDQRMAEPWFDPAGFFVAAAAGEVSTASTDGWGEGDLLGFHWTKVHDEQPPFGEVYVVGVSPRAQGSGLGSLLTLTGLHHLADRGLPEVILYVEADNAPAVSVYTRLGFAHADEDTDVRYERR
jgi:mycothiol synthase